jgi:hypothetical protein
MQKPAIGLVLTAALADAAGAHSLSFLALVLAVPATAAAALVALGSAFEPGDSRAVGRAWVQGAALALVLLSAAVRAPFRESGTVPRLGTTALVACLLLFAGQAAVALWPHVRRHVERRFAVRSLPRY